MGRANLVWNAEDYPAIESIMSAHGFESDTAFLRHCVLFYLENRDKTTFEPVEVLSRLDEILSMLQKGVLVASNGQEEQEPSADDLLSGLIGQI